MQSFQDEYDILKAESVATTASLQKTKTKSEISAQEVSEKTKQLELFRKRIEEMKALLETEKQQTLSKEKINQHVEERLKAREKDLRSVELETEALRERMFKDSQHLAKLRKQESNLIAEIKSTQVSAQYEEWNATNFRAWTNNSLQLV